MTRKPTTATRLAAVIFGIMMLPAWVGLLDAVCSLTGKPGDPTIIEWTGTRIGLAIVLAVASWMLRITLRMFR